MTERAPDIEIYLKRVSTEAILDWLQEKFAVDSTRQSGNALHVRLSTGMQTIDAMIVENAARGGYTSLWFKQNQTAWATDEACAQEAFAHFNAEIRCSRSGWTDGQPDEGAWLRFTDQGVAEVNWRT